jgi:hypothetical protein
VLDTEVIVVAGGMTIPSASKIVNPEDNAAVKVDEIPVMVCDPDWLAPVIPTLLERLPLVKSTAPENKLPPSITYI